MITSTSARNSANSIVTGMTYFDTLISGATSQGLFQITVDGNKMSPSQITTLTSNGYTVYTRYTDMGTFPQYVISW
jgi:hypothetical protein